ncbi:MAG: SDR family oxidoreductase [Polyangiaceae bacterium]|nr:SDR family oxidoreductase [Polyangiaceae bacterium]MCW5792598.1 SDR family oxidoreductase [Polyangiaceae bacterium]
MGLLKDRVAVVTGAGGGIGAATARLFAAEGAKVVVNDVGGQRDGRTEDAGPAAAIVSEIVASGGQAVASAHSVATPEGAAAIIQTAVDHFGRLDVLVNNAGILRDKTLLKLELTDWDAVIAVHLTGSFLCTQAAARQLRAQNSGGSIVNTTSVSGMFGNFGQTNYSAAKAGIYGLTRTTSIELQRFGIRVNAVAPLAKTRMTEDLPMFEKVESMTPEHVAPVHLFLASDLASEVTGQVISVAGGKLSAYVVRETPGRMKEVDSGVWRATEIAEHFGSITKL